MEGVLKSDIFFFIASISAILVAVFLAVAIFYLIVLLREMRDLLIVMRSGAENISDEIEQVRKRLNSGAIWTRFLMSTIAFVGKIAQKHDEEKETSKRTKKKKS